MRTPRFIRELARGSLRRHGLALVRYSPDEYPHLLRHRILSDDGVDLVLDVGANLGQYVDHLRGEGYTGRIVSFEPTAETFRELSARSASDPAWEVRKVALGAELGTMRLHRYEESAYNSVLRGVEGAGVPAEVGDEDVELTTLDALEGEAWTHDNRICLKVDVQGFEEQVLSGARGLLAECAVVEVELSTVEIYEGQALFPELAAMLYAAGMRMVSFRPIVVHANGFVDQADALFVAVDGRSSHGRKSDQSAANSRRSVSTGRVVGSAQVFGSPPGPLA